MTWEKAVTGLVGFVAGYYLMAHYRRTKRLV